MFYVYVLQSKDRFYIGSTDNLKRRIKEHNAGQNIATKPYLPWSLICYEAHFNQEDSLRREKYLKKNQGKHALRRMLKCYLGNEGRYFDY